MKWKWYQLPTQKEQSALREDFMANKLDADVVFIGPGHMRNFLAQTKNTRSLGVVVPPETINYMPIMLEDPLKETEQGFLLSDLEQIKKLVLERVKSETQ